MVESVKNKYKIKNLLKDIKPIKIELSDIPQIKEIYKSFWGEVDLYKNSIFNKIIKQNYSYGYKLNNEIIGYCLVEYQKKENIAEIDLLCIKKEYQGYHLGKNLLSFCINNCLNLNIKNFGLHVSTNNIYAIKLYRKQGFKKKYFLEHYYNDKHPEDNDAYFMELKMI